MPAATDKQPGVVGVFVRLWFVLAIGYALLKLAVDLAFGRFIDLRAVAGWELLLVPLGQAVVVYVIRRRARRVERARDIPA